MASTSPAAESPSATIPRKPAQGIAGRGSTATVPGVGWARTCLQSPLSPSLDSGVRPARTSFVGSYSCPLLVSPCNGASNASALCGCRPQRRSASKNARAWNHTLHSSDGQMGSPSAMALTSLHSSLEKGRLQSRTTSRLRKCHLFAPAARSADHLLFSPDRHYSPRSPF